MQTNATESVNPPETVTYISWAESCSRSDHTARELGGRSHMVYRSQYGSRAETILLKYAGQWLETRRILKQELPDVVFVMTPPLVAALPALAYARRFGKKVVLDAHSAAFLHPRWRHLLWLQRMLCRRAATTLVHNEQMAAIVRAAGGHATLVPDVPILYTEVEAFPRTERFTVAVVCSFNYDEPVAAIFDAAAALPDVSFYVTGNPKHLHPSLAATAPANLQLTGFLNTAAYGGLLTSADVVLTLTTRDHTMLRGAYEAIYQGTPVIVSDWPLLKTAFPEGAVHTDNTARGIISAIDQIRTNPEPYRGGARRLRERKRAQWQSTRAQIIARITT